MINVAHSTPPVLLPETGSKMSLLNPSVWKSSTPRKVHTMLRDACGCVSRRMAPHLPSSRAGADIHEFGFLISSPTPQFLGGLPPYFGRVVSKFIKNKMQIPVWNFEFPASLRVEIHRIYLRRSCQELVILLAVQLSLRSSCLGKISSV